VWLLATAQEELQVLFKEVPQYNKFTLKRILMCLSKVVEESAENKMDAPNLATIFGPSFFRPPPSGAATAPTLAMAPIMAIVDQHTDRNVCIYMPHVFVSCVCRARVSFEHISDDE
jgi:hypothetical protein